MKRIVRVTGLTVAAFSVVVGAAFAGPSQAGESTLAPITAHYSDHVAAGPVASVLVVNPADPIPSSAPATQVEDAAPIIQHAVATVEVDVVEPVEEPRASRTKSLSELVNVHASSEVPDAEMECLAGAVYFESKGEPLAGQLAVAEVIINRARSGRFPSSYCGVVKQRGQFSFVRGGRLPAIPRGTAAWRKAVAIAHIATKDLATGNVPRALFFHARRVSPGWKLTRVASVGNHIFYR